jgi:hypothetical protein
MHASDVEMTIVGGEIVYERGQWMNVDHGRALYDLRCAVRRLGAGAASSAGGES